VLPWAKPCRRHHPSGYPAIAVQSQVPNPGVVGWPLSAIGASAAVASEGTFPANICGVVFAEAVSMWEFLGSALSAIPSAASSKYAFGAYAMAILGYVITVWRVVRNKNLLENLQKLPPKDRLSALEIETGGVRLAAGISPEQWVRSRIHRYYLFAFLATCAVVCAIAALAVWSGVTYVESVTVINNEYRQSNNGESLSISDLQHIKDLIEGATAHDAEQVQAAFNQLSDKARTAYERAYPSTKDNLPPPDELNRGAGKTSPPAVPNVQEAAGKTPPPTTPSAPETEANSSILKAKVIALNATIRGVIDGNSDARYFTFTMPGTRRDYIDVVLTNESTTLSPQITVYNPDKGEQGRNYNSTSGGDVSYSFVAQPNIRYYIGVSCYNSSSGSYQLTARPRNAYDAYEPNDDILSAASIVIGKTIEAGIMDPDDVDYFRFDTDKKTKLSIVLENRSTTLSPQITVYNPDKGEQGRNYNSTSGGDVSYSFVAQPDSRYYVKVSRYNNSFGNYALTIRAE
jgi:hypothetical protein